MITGVHSMFYTSDAEATRAFLRDKLNFPFTDVGGGWLIFEMPDADMGCHPADAAHGAPPGRHDISFFCDDIQKTIAGLKSQGVTFTEEPSDQGYGIVTHFQLPGVGPVQLYQPHYKRNPQTV